MACFYVDFVVKLKKYDHFLSSPLAGKRDIVVTILVWCMCMGPFFFLDFDSL